MSVHTAHKTHDRYATRALDPALSQSIHNRQKYHLKAGRDYLHWSAGFLTPDRKQAWSGTIEQARACRRTFNAAAGCKAHAVSPIPAHTEQDA